MPTQASPPVGHLKKSFAFDYAVVLFANRKGIARLALASADTLGSLLEADNRRDGNPSLHWGIGHSSFEISCHSSPSHAPV